MKEFSKELRNMLTDFIVSEIGSKGIDGVTYTLKLDSSKNREEIEIYTRIREEATRCGYDDKELFRAFEVNNGVVFDMDIKAMAQILIKIAQSASAITGKHADMNNMVYSEPENVRKSEVVRLANSIKKEAEKGGNKITVALFNRNRINRVHYSEREGDEAKVYTMEAFKVRTNDILYLNQGPLKEMGYVVRQVIPRYILPTENGLVTEIVFEKRRVNNEDRGKEGRVR